MFKIMRRIFMLLNFIFNNMNYAQLNLVPNGSFEIVNQCPESGNDFTLKSWFMPTLGTSNNFLKWSIRYSGLGKNFKFSAGTSLNTFINPPALSARIIAKTASPMMMMMLCMKSVIDIAHMPPMYV